MIEGALYHLPGVGPETIRRFQSMELTTWSALESRPHDIPLGAAPAAKLLAAVQASRALLAEENLTGLTTLLDARDQWRIVNEQFDHAAWFDIETDGCSTGSIITCICAYHNDQVHTFMRGENLQDFIDWLQTVDLLVSFNGASFDVPFIMRGFALPSLPCAHVDLRWVAYHAGMKGGLKKIEGDLHIERPDDLIGVDGAEAVWLWEDWNISKNAAAREKLLRYCAADVVGLKAVAASLLRSMNPEFSGMMPAGYWGHIQVPSVTPTAPAPVVENESRGLDPDYERLQNFRRRQRSG